MYEFITLYEEGRFDSKDFYNYTEPNLPDTDKIKEFLYKIRPLEEYSEKLCWEWNGSLNKAGYGDLSYNGAYLPVPKKAHTIGAHRFSYWIFNKVFPGEKVVRHKCDNKKCVNPFHLELGTRLDNLKDLVEQRKGTRNKKILGEYDAGNSNKIPPINELLTAMKHWRLRIIEHKYHDFLSINILIYPSKKVLKLIKDNPNPFNFISNFEPPAPSLNSDDEVEDIEDIEPEAEEVDFGDESLDNSA